jgi:hypothetical protein
MARAKHIVIGLLVTRDDRDLVDRVAAELPEALRERVARDVDWRVEVVETDPADVAAGPADLIETVRRRLIERRWQLAIGLTALPLRDGSTPVLSHASASHGVGLISVPALGAIHRDERLLDAVVEVVQLLLRDERGRDELSVPVAGAARAGTVRFTARVVRSNVRLLTGMIRANRPTRVMARLSRSATAALGTGMYALTSANLWTVADRSSWTRLVTVGALAMALVLVTLVIAHDLWERAEDPPARERVVLFNAVTVITLAIGIATLYLALFVGMSLGGGVILPPAAIEQQLDHPVGVDTFLRIAWFVASVAALGGAFGSLLESHEAVRAAAYRSVAGAEADRARRDQL